MSRLFTFLGAINAGPGRVVKMNTLCQAFESLGFSGVATFLGSGNVVFETRARDIGKIEKKIERRLQRALGRSVPVIVRTHVELKEIVALIAAFTASHHGADVNIILLADSLSERSKAMGAKGFVGRPSSWGCELKEGARQARVPIHA